MITPHGFLGVLLSQIDMRRICTSVFLPVLAYDFYPHLLLLALNTLLVAAFTLQAEVVSIPFTMANNKGSSRLGIERGISPNSYQLPSILGNWCKLLLRHTRSLFFPFYANFFNKATFFFSHGNTDVEPVEWDMNSIDLSHTHLPFPPFRSRKISTKIQKQLVSPKFPHARRTSCIEAKKEIDVPCIFPKQWFVYVSENYYEAEEKLCPITKLSSEATETDKVFSGLNTTFAGLKEIYSTVRPGTDSFTSRETSPRLTVQTQTCHPNKGLSTSVVPTRTSLLDADMCFTDTPLCS